MNRTYLAFAAAGILLLMSHRAEAQVPPFFGGGGIFDPEISVVQSGVILDAQAVVSADRKYVTLTTRAQNAQLLALREFAFQTGGGAPGGQLGGGVAGAAAIGNGFSNGAEADDRSTSQHAVPRKAYPKPGEARGTGASETSVLEKEGMTLIGRVGAKKE
jgi:hypothetical protein